jgi:carboxymethylenebutenolidase
MDRIYVMQLVHSFQTGQLSQRDFITQAAAALGSMSTANTLLAACGPTPQGRPPVVVKASAIAEPPPAQSSTGSQFITESAAYPGVAGETLTGYLARPAGEGRRPGVIVIQEWWGLNEHIKDVARRFAQAGFVALAPDLYHGVVVSEPDEARKLVMELDMDEAVREIRQAVAFLGAQDYVAGPQVGIVGFCMGGRLVLQTARVEDHLGAAVVFYGSPLTPQEASEAKSPVLGLYGALDHIPVADVRAMHEAFDRAEVENELHIYEGASHAFFNDTRSSYRPEAAADAWPRTLTWFREHLSG